MPPNVNEAGGVVMQLIALGDGRLEVGTSWRSEAYGARREAPSVAYRAAGSGRQHGLTVLVPAAAHARLQSVVGASSAEVVGPRFKDMVLRRQGATPLEVGGVITDAEVALLARRRDGAPERLYLLGATFAEGAGLARATIAAGALFVARHDLGEWRADSSSLGSSGQD